MRAALVHYWLVSMRGGEAVLDALMALLPGADVFTNVYDPQAVAELFQGRRRPQTTWINRLPAASRLYPYYMPLMPAALSGLDLSGYDLVISSEAGPAKWAMAPLSSRHICYAHTPMRYLYDQRHAYRERVAPAAKPFYDIFGEELRLRDYASASRVDDFVANSNFVARRIDKLYRRPSTVIHPPVAQADIPPPAASDDRYLFVGQLVPYKAVREAVDACVALGRRLLVVGEGPDEGYVRRFADRGVEHRRRLSRQELVACLGRCRALLSPGVEDFGITAVEALAAGRPVLALGQGGATDTVSHGRTGLLYPHGGVESLKRAILALEEWEPGFQPGEAVQAARAFSPEVFAARWRQLLGLDRLAPVDCERSWAAPYPFASGATAAASASSSASMAPVRMA